MEDRLLIIGIGVSEHVTDGVNRFCDNCRNLGLDYVIAGEGKKWTGGDMEKGPGGGQKINELKLVLDELPMNRLIIGCDTFDLFPVAGEREILEKYHQLCPNNEVLFSAELTCWPDKSLANKYPSSMTGYRYLNSGSFMGYRDDLLTLVSGAQVSNTDDDQLYFTRLFLGTDSNIILDHHCQLFQTLAGTNGTDIRLCRNRIYNTVTNSYPVFIHGNGMSKYKLNHYQNYIDTGSHYIRSDDSENSRSKIFMALYIDSSKRDVAEKFLSNIDTFIMDNYFVWVYDSSSDAMTETLCLSKGISYSSDVTGYRYSDFLNSSCQFYVIWDQRYRLWSNQTIPHLIDQIDDSHRIISPLLRAGDTAYSNFWGALDNKGFYARSDDYFHILNDRSGTLWNVPYVSGVVVMRRDIVENWDLNRCSGFSDPDMNLCANLRHYVLFMYLDNKKRYGHIVE